MQAPSSDQTGVLALAVACLIPGLAAAWRSATLRGDTFEKWSERVDVAHAGLNERVTAELLALQDDIGDLLGGAAGFTPAEVWVDPDPLVSRANRCAMLLRARDKLRGRFRRLRQLGPLLMLAVGLYLVGWLAVTLEATDVIERTWVKSAGLSVGALGTGLGIVVFCLYAYWQSKLARAEELGAKAD